MPAAPSVRALPRGFTLIETLIVLLISVGLVALMAVLFRAVGTAAVGLRGGNVEWSGQTLMRAQLQQLFSIPGEAHLRGDENELLIFTWRSARHGVDAMPVVASYRCDGERRSLVYREHPLPPWWSKPPKLSEEGGDVRQETESVLVGGIEGCAFRFVAADAADLSPQYLGSNWQKAEAPKLVLLQYTRGGREHSFWFDLRAHVAS